MAVEINAIISAIILYLFSLFSLLYYINLDFDEHNIEN